MLLAAKTIEGHRWLAFSRKWITFTGISCFLIVGPFMFNGDFFSDRAKTKTCRFATPWLSELASSEWMGFMKIDRTRRSRSWQAFVSVLKAAATISSILQLIPFYAHGALINSTSFATDSGQSGVLITSLDIKETDVSTTVVVADAPGFAPPGSVTEGEWTSNAGTLRPFPPPGYYIEWGGPILENQDGSFTQPYWVVPDGFPYIVPLISPVSLGELPITVLSTVPEPHAWVLLALGGTAILSYRLYFRKAPKSRCRLI